MKKLKKCISICLTIALSISPVAHVLATDFASDESYWHSVCDIPAGSDPQNSECAAFRAYYKNKLNEVNREINNLASQTNDIKGNITKIQSTLKSLQSSLNSLSARMQETEKAISQTKEQITALDESIRLKQIEIDKLNNLIMNRMRSEQSTMGTSLDIEIIMGANSLMDMIRKARGIQKITESDQEDVKQIKIEKKKLDEDKQKVILYQEELRIKNAQNEEDLLAVATAKQQQSSLLETYQQQEADLAEKMRSAKTDMNAIRGNIISITDASDMDFSNNNGFIMPVRGGYISAGTWYYPGGGVHLGMDKAVPIGTPVVAPSDSIVLYANNPVGSASGYLGNWSGHPQGGGNTIHLLTQVRGITYGLSFFHLSQEGFAVGPGSRVAAGQYIALTGNSGNSSGPHCHMEIVNLGLTSINAAIAQFQRTADFAWGTGWGSASVGRTCSVSGPPCRERPENLY